MSLDRVNRLLAQLGDPQDRLPPVIHIAGTNGKGSVVAFLRAMFEAAGYRVHAYTSPHLVDFTERIVIAGRQVDPVTLISLLDEVEAINGDAPITFFEITTALALLAFARTPADIVLLETGLGGRLDATNVVARPTVTVITPIGIDHQAFLGPELADIAAEKAGILKPETPCVIAAQAPAAVSVITERAAAVGAPLAWEGDAWTARPCDGGFLFDDGTRERSLPAPALAGAHQVANAGLAIAAALRVPSLPMGDRSIARGMESAAWPARLQRLNGGRLTAQLRNGTELWLDGGHNPHAAGALAAWAATDGSRPLDLIVGMMRGKNAADFLAPLVGLARRLIAVPVPGSEKAYAAEELAAVARATGLTAECADDVEQAMARLSDGAAARILICGSLYLAGDVLRRNDGAGGS